MCVNLELDLEEEEVLLVMEAFAKNEFNKCSYSYLIEEPNKASIEEREQALFDAFRNQALIRAIELGIEHENLNENLKELLED